MSKHRSPARESARALRSAATALLTRAAWNGLSAEEMLKTAGRLVRASGDALRRAVVLGACRCARLALRFVPEGEDRPLRAIETTEAWTRKEATVEEVWAARDAAYDAYAAAHAAAYAADANAAYAAAYDVDGPTYDTAYDAYAAADTAASAYAAAWSAARAAYPAADAADAADAARWAKRAGAAEAELQDAVRGLWHDVDDAQLRKLAAEDPEALAANLYGEQGRGGRLETCDADERGRLEALSIELEGAMGVRTEVWS